MCSGKIMFSLPNTLSFRLTLWYALIFVALVVFAFFLSYLTINSILNQMINEDLGEDVTEFSVMLTKGGVERVTQELEEEASTESMEGEFIRILYANGDEIYSSDLSAWKGLNTDLEILRELKQVQSDPIFQTVKLHSREYGTRIIYGWIGEDIVLHAGESLQYKEELMNVLLLVFVSIIVLAIPFASVSSWIVAKRAVRGINEVSRAAIDIKKGKLDRRVAIEAKSDEVQKLVDTFNAMAERIRSLIVEMREMIDNIAHDLRSPMARIRAISEASLYGVDSPQVYRAAAADTIVECDRLIKLINTTLDVAELEADVSDTLPESIDVSDLVEEACELFEPVAEEKNIGLETLIDPGLTIKGNRQNLQRMFANLLDNAIKYTGHDGMVKVELGGDDRKICISIFDTGIGIPLSDQHRVFSRFFRCDQSRQQEGCGLGLSFARAVARAHGGDITLVSIPDECSTFTITLSRL